MDFEYTGVITICDDDLEEMCYCVENGENFSVVFDDIMSGYDSCDYYNCGCIYDSVKKEINRRLAERRK